ncbi:peroxide stress protein YaaA [bacterium]|nr:peroxide stress protein YaaA [bacterium]
MIIIISPAKSMNMLDPAHTETYSLPDHLSQSKHLIRVLKKFNRTELMDLMSISKKIADLNRVRYKAFKPPFQLVNAKQALFAFTGDVYRHMRISTYDDDGLDFAQNSLRIISGLYGSLRPLDLIQAYRLEMKTRLKTDRGSDLYQFWGDRITTALNKDLRNDPSPVLINLASKEYAKVVNFKLIKAPVISIDFKEVESGKAHVIAIFAKWARGLMTDFIIQKRITNPEDLKAFDLSDYKFSKEDSSDLHWIFTRPRPD